MEIWSVIKFLLIVHLIFLQTEVNGQRHLEVTQPAMVKAEAGESATIICSFMSATPSYFVTWTLGCNNSALQLKDHPCFQGRINVSTPETPNNTQEKKTMLTILNLTESDSVTICCHIKTGEKETGKGNGTSLEVSPRSCPAGYFNTLQLPMEILRLVCLIVLILLQGIAVKMSC